MNDIEKQVEIFLSDKPNIAAAFGYGSSFYQKKKPDDKPQVDLIIVPEDVIAYHHENREKHPEEYRFLDKNEDRYFTRHKSYDPGVYIASYLKSGDCTIKTMTVAKEYFMDDCYNNCCNYIAGRMQKIPKAFRSNPEIQKALAACYRNAILFSLTLCSDYYFTYEYFFQTIINLSFNGDIRNLLRAESPTKKQDIYDEKYEEFLTTYNISDFEGVDTIEEGVFSVNEKAFLDIINELPFIINNNLNSNDLRTLRENLSKKLFQITRKASFIQACNGVATIGLQNAVAYGLRKFMKGHKKPQQKI